MLRLGSSTSIKPLLLAVLAILTGATNSVARSLTATSDSSPFPAEELQRGTTSTEVQCASIPLAAWVVVDGKGDCIRFYASGLMPRINPEVFVYFEGDHLTNDLRILGNYDKKSPASIQQEVDLRAAQSGKPYLFIGRPGTYGSSGFHGDRRRPREGKLIIAALDAIKAKYNIGTYHMAGQSGGGGLVATMLNMRGDIGCAVIASGAVSVWMLAAQKGRNRDTNNSTDSYDPVDHVADIRKSPALRIFVLSSRHDQNVLFKTQEHYVKQLRRVGLAPVHVELPGTGTSFHGLSEFAKPALGWCAQGLPDAEIRRRLEARTQ